MMTRRCARAARTITRPSEDQLAELLGAGHLRPEDVNDYANESSRKL